MGRKAGNTAGEAIVNRKARREYEVLETLEAGIALVGTEVKSMRAGQVSLNEAFIRARRDGLWLEQAHFGEYAQGNLHNHEPLRPRLKLYFKGKWAKVELGLGRGRKLHDKREVVKSREAAREIRRHTGRS
ncbi:MAG: SsrA-binding protein [Planctomycetota bacterium]|jgi:SsrA-binding protein